MSKKIVQRANGAKTVIEPGKGIVGNVGGKGQTSVPSSRPSAKHPKNAEKTPGHSFHEPASLNISVTPQRTPPLTRMPEKPVLEGVGADVGASVFEVDSVKGFPFRVRVVKPGELYGRDGVYVNNDEPLVEFYDSRHPSSDSYTNELGQFITRYHASTLLNDANPNVGLRLYGDVPAWEVPAEWMTVVRDRVSQACNIYEDWRSGSGFSYEWSARPSEWEDNRSGCNSCDRVGGVVETRGGYCPECYFEAVTQ